MLEIISTHHATKTQLINTCSHYYALDRFLIIILNTNFTLSTPASRVLTHSQTAPAIIILDVLLQFGEHLNVIPILKFILGSLGAIICLLRESITIASSISANYGPTIPT